MAKIAHLVKNACSPDWRVIKAAESAAAESHNVTIFAAWKNGERPLEVINNVEYTRVYPDFDYHTPRRLKRLIPNKPQFVPGLVSRLAGLLKRLKVTKVLSRRAKDSNLIEMGFLRNAYRFVLKFNPDILHCHDLETLKTGVMIKKKIGCRLVYDSHEFEQNKNPPADRLTNLYIRRHERELLANVDHVVTVGDDIADRLQAIYKLKSRPVVVHNCPRYTSKHDKDACVNLIDDKFIYKLYTSAEEAFDNLDDAELESMHDDCVRHELYFIAKRLRLHMQQYGRKKNNKNFHRLIDEIRSLGDFNSDSFVTSQLRFRKALVCSIKIEQINNALDGFKSVGLYVGNLTVGRGIETIVLALSMIEGHAFAFVGPRNNPAFIKNLHDLIDKYGLGHRIYFFESLDDSLIEFISKFDYSIVSTDPVSDSTNYSMPNKLFESAHANIPILCSNTYSASRFVLKYKKGEIYQSTNQYDLASKICLITENKKSYICDSIVQEEFTKLYSYEEQYAKLSYIYNNI